MSAAGRAAAQAAAELPEEREALAAELAHMQIAIRNAVRREPAGEGAAPPSRAAAVHAEAIKFAGTGRKSTSVG